MPAPEEAPKEEPTQEEDPVKEPVSGLSFNDVDVNGDGVITKKEWDSAMKNKEALAEPEQAQEEVTKEEPAQVEPQETEAPSAMDNFLHYYLEELLNKV